MTQQHKPVRAQSMRPFEGLARTRNIVVTTAALLVLAPQPSSAQSPTTTAAPPLTTPIPSTESDVLICDGGWRYELEETREEIGPARFSRQHQLQKDIQFANAAFAYCAGAANAKFDPQFGLADANGPCNGLLAAADKVTIAAAQLFNLKDNLSCECMTQPVDSGSTCEGLRGQLTTLRRYDDIVVQRAELVLAVEVCAANERKSNAGLHTSCTNLTQVLAKEAAGGGKPGYFTLSAPLPASVASAIEAIRKVTDGRFLSVLPENFIGVRQSLCNLPVHPVKQNECTAEPIKKAAKPGKAVQGAALYREMQSNVTGGMCNELALADVNANTCRDADVYIDERGQIHLNSPLTTRAQRENATMCIDISDFDQNHPLMVTLGLDPTGSVPKRLWPGETMKIGDIIDRPVSASDILQIHVLGKALGVSLSEVLRVNSILRTTLKQNKDDACRIARSWVPVVDHEVPIGAPNKQAVIPIKFGRGRDGETRQLTEGDFVVLWIRDIEPNGAVRVSYADGQYVGYSPPPLLGESDKMTTDGRAAADTSDPREPGKRTRSDQASVAKPLLPRRARYPGSRVLRLGSPKGNHSYDIKVCKPKTTVTAQDINGDGRIDATELAGQVTTIAPSTSLSCDGQDILLDERVFVEGDSHFGLKFHFGYSYFPIKEFEARRTPAAVAAGENVFEVVQTSSGQASYDVAVLLAVYPLGRNPRKFSYNPMTKDYWKHASLNIGFTARRLTPWNDFYIGASLPVANGVSLDLLSHFSRREIPTNLQPGTLVTDANLTNSSTKEALAVGFTAGLSFDYNLFERAFINAWDKISGQRGQFYTATGRE